MNHHEFRNWAKNLTSQEIKLFNINPAHFKAVCFVLSMYGDYATGTSIRPSWLTVANEAGVNRKTAMKVRDLLINLGILIEKRKLPTNISEYEFGQLSISETQLSISECQLSNIDGHNITIDTTSNSNTDAPLATLGGIDLETSIQEEDLFPLGYKVVKVKESNYKDIFDSLFLGDTA